MIHISQQNPRPVVECDRVYKEYQAGTAGSCTLQFFHRLGSVIKPCPDENCVFEGTAAQGGKFSSVSVPVLCLDLS